IYTSGTTGTPKGVMVHHGGMVNHMFAKIRDLDITKDDRLAQTASPGFDISVWQFLAALLVGGTTVIIDKQMVLEPELFLAELQKRRVTILEAVPSVMTVFLESVDHVRDHRLEFLRWMIPTGEPLTPALAAQWFKYYPRIKLVNAYGPTEASDDVTHYILDGAPSQNRLTVPIGKPLQNTHVYIVDRDLNLCPVGVRGEICVAGLGVGKGYWKDEAKTEKAFIPNPFMDDLRDKDYEMLYKTGDIGYFREDGRIECLGRLDNQVKIRGNRIELGDIESQLLQNEHVKEATVDIRESVAGREKFLCAYLVMNSKIDIYDIRQFLASRVPDYMVPRYLVRMKSMPLTAAGKVNRNALPVPEMQMEEEYTPPTDRVEKKMVDIWARVLEIPAEKVGIDRDFFALGGHSLKATVLTSAIRKGLGVKLPLAHIFKYPNIRGLAEAVRQEGKRKYAAIEAGEKKNCYRLSPAQERLFYRHGEDTDGTGCNLSMTVLLEGELDMRRLRLIFKSLIRRHDNLRTSFHIRYDNPVQVIEADVPFSLAEGEVSDVSGEPGVSIKEWFRPFDIASAPLMRAKVLKMEARRALVVVDMHRLIADEFSQGILAWELMQLYNENPLAPMLLQYKDFSQWQNRFLQTDALQRQAATRRETFSDDLPLLNLPTDFPRPTDQTCESASVTFTLNMEKSSALKKLAESNDIAMFTLLMAAYNVFLAKLGGGEDIIVGVPENGRNHPGTEDIMGVLTNMLPMRNFPEGNKSLSRFLEEVKIESGAAFENHELQYEELVKTLGIKEQPGRNPLFDTKMTMQSVEVPTIKIPGLRLSPLQEHPKTVSLDLGLIIEVGETIRCLFEYNCRLFSRNRIETFAFYYKKVISGFLTGLETLIADVEILSEDEKHRLLWEFNGPSLEIAEPLPLHSLFERQVELTPGSTAMCCGDSQVSYGYLNEVGNCLAFRLREAGAGRGVIVGLMGRPSIERACAMLAILKVGSAYMPIGPGESPEKISFMLRDSTAEILVVGEEVQSELNIEALNPKPLILAVSPTAMPGVDTGVEYESAGATAESPAYLMYTE
ncbi:MAG: AMP-binding protein, partial [bacterium]|nr:AMP-binding protein [bacterium]